MQKLLRDHSGSSAAEFAIVLPFLLVFIFGIIDAARWMWVYNQAEKAAQMGARMAIVTYPIEPGVGATYVGVGGLTQGDSIPAGAFGKVTCTDTSCTCTTTPCPTLGTRDAATFTAIVTRMQNFLPTLTASNVAIEYSSSGIGYAGNPNGPDIAPLVTVKIGAPATPLPFTPITTLLLTTFNMPTFTTSLTGEDFAGSQSN